MSLIVALSLAVVLGFVGLALDGGHLYLTRTELQNAADACALAASRELTGAGTLSLEQRQRAEILGRDMARRNRQAFQSAAVDDAQILVRFGTALDAAGVWADASGAPADARLVRCTLERAGITPWFMQVLGFGAQAVRAAATASLVPAQRHCAIPMAVCTKGPGAPDFGLVPGQWISGRFNAGGGVTGSFNWIDYTPPAGGASELGELLRGRGQCSLDASVQVGQPGNLGQAAARAWNTRFGLYQTGQEGPDRAAPDFTGHAYTPLNWPAQSQALADFLIRRRSHDPYGSSVAAGNAQTGLSLSAAYDPASTTQTHRDWGIDRRLVVAPVVDCGDWAGSQTATVQGWACLLMLHPIGGPGDDVRLEIVGPAGALGSPCGSQGVPGDAGGIGARVPALVQ